MFRVVKRSSSRWVTGVRYVLVGLVSVGVAITGVMIGAVYFRRRW